MNIGQIVVGLVLALVATGGLLYIFYTRTNPVEKAGSGALIMLAVVSLMIPVFWLMDGSNQASAKSQQYVVAVTRGMDLYAQYCVYKCYTIINGKLASPAYNGYSISAMNNMSDSALLRMIDAGVYNPALPAPPNSNDVVMSTDFGGPLSTNSVNYLFAFLRSADPAYLQQNGYTGSSAVNGFNQLANYLQNNSPTAYATAVAQGRAGSFGTATDLTNSKNLTINITDTAPGQTCNPSCFQYLNAKVKVGTTITWVNKSTFPHTVTALYGDGSSTAKKASQIFDSGITTVIQPGQSFKYTVTQAAYTFNTNHTVVYFCQIHPTMLAELTIVP